MPDSDVNTQVRKEDVLADLIGWLREVIGSDAVDILRVTGSTRIFTELGLNSIDFVQLGELIDEKYPVSEQLVDLIADAPLLKLARVTVLDIVELICHAMG